METESEKLIKATIDANKKKKQKEEEERKEKNEKTLKEYNIRRRKK